MKPLRHTLCISAAIALLSACNHVPTPLTEQPYTHFEPTIIAEGRQSVLPSGVAVLYDYPSCAFEELGEAYVTHHTHEITPSRIEALRQQAAIYGADAIVIHPTLPNCIDGEEELRLCPGRGEHIIATAIHYPEPEQLTQYQPTLDVRNYNSYDIIELEQ